MNIGNLSGRVNDFHFHSNIPFLTLQHRESMAAIGIWRPSESPPPTCRLFYHDKTMQSSKGVADRFSWVKRSGSTRQNATL